MAKHQERCGWCGEELLDRRTIGPASRFCSEGCRASFGTAAVLYVRQLIDQGWLKIADLRGETDTRSASAPSIKPGPELDKMRDLPEYFTVRELSERFRCTNKTIRRFIRLGEFEVLDRPGGHKLIPSASVVDFEARYRTRVQGPDDGGGAPADPGGKRAKPMDPLRLALALDAVKRKPLR